MRLRTAKGSKAEKQVQVPGVSQVAPALKNLAANAGDVRDTSSIPGWGRSSGGGNRNLLQYSCLENPIDRGAWWATVHGVTKSQTRLNTHTGQTVSCS